MKILKVCNEEIITVAFLFSDKKMVSIILISNQTYRIEVNYNLTY